MPPAQRQQVVVRREPQGGVILTEEIVDAVCEFIRYGASLDVAAERLGISRSTIQRWLSRGKAAINLDPAAADGDGPEAIFAKLVERRPQAEATSEIALVGLIVKSAQGGVEIENRRIVHPNGDVETIVRKTAPDWRAAAHILQHRMAARWGREVRLNVHATGPEAEGSRSEGERLNGALGTYLARRQLEAAEHKVIEGEVVQ